MNQNSTKDSSTPPTEPGWLQRSFNPFRKAVVRGLAIVTPPLLTIVLFLWAWNIIDTYVLAPVETIARFAITLAIADVREDKDVTEELERLGVPDAIDTNSDPHQYSAQDGKRLVKINQKWIPREVFDVVESNPGDKRPDSARTYYHRYVQLEFLPRHLVIPAFLIVFVLVLYLLGRLFTFGLGRWIWAYIESLIGRLPIVSNVYSSVKQVTDFAFSENEIQFTRVVAVEYPRKGIWTIGFVTGESMLDIRTAANEPVVSVLMPTSPMPATGFVISIPKSQTIDLDITMDQAIQWCVSCGVVVPNHQQARTIGPSSPMPAISLPPTTEPGFGTVSTENDTTNRPGQPTTDNESLDDRRANNGNPNDANS